MVLSARVLVRILPWEALRYYHGVSKRVGLMNQILLSGHDLRQYSVILSSHHTKPPGPEEAAIINKFNRDLIRQSKLKFVLLCGPDAERSVLPDFSRGSTPSITLGLRGYKFKTFLEIDSLDIKHIYLQSPAPLSSLWSNKWSEAIQICELFRFAAVITQTTGISPYFFDSALIYTSIIGRYEDECNGCPKMTCETIDPNFRG